MSIVTPWQGEPGYVCCPRAENVKVRQPDYELIECPHCGAECYVTPAIRKLVVAHPQLKAVCTVCALRLSAQEKVGGRHA
jgi:transcription elongation factor Elf1